MWNVIEVSPTVRPYEDRIRASLDAVRRRIEEVAELQPVRFVLKADRTRTLEIHGYGGFCADPDLVRLSFDPKNPNMERHLDETLERTIAHEYHHALRAAGPGYGAKLGSALAAEGLAGHFVRQLYGSPPEPWECALSDDELAPWRREAHERFGARDHGHARWFFGADDRPRWLGYTLGYDMIGRYLADHVDRTALDLAATPAVEFRDRLLSSETRADRPSG